MPGLSSYLVSALSLASVALASPIAKAQLVGRDTSLLASYDYVIVGGGTSGLIVADRLTENSSKTVLVIESGNLDDQEDEVLVPGMAGGTGKKYMYNMTCIPQKNINNRTYSLLAAHVVGGGTVVNGMFFDRGSRGDYDLWEALGNPGWGWNGIYPYFKKSETFSPPDKALADEFNITYDPSAHGYQGVIKSSFPKFQYQAVKDWFKAFKQIGIPIPKDGANGDAIGAFWVSNSLDNDNQTRSYARRYYEEAKKRSNYHLITGKTVTKLVLSGTTVTGVEFAGSATETATKVSAKKEVVLAAGTAHTPQLLQLAGIGPKKLLESLGIKVVVDLPGVGSNFQDHPVLYFSGSFSNDYPINPALLTSNATYAAEQLALYRTKREGPYTISRGNSVAFNTLPQLSSQSIANNLMQKALSQNPADFYPAGTDSTILEGHKRQTELLANYISSGRVAIQEIAFGGSAGGGNGLEKPFSRGSININSTDPWAAPVVDYGVMSNPVDMDMMVQLIRFVWRLYDTPALQALGAKALTPDPANDSDEAIKAAIRATLTPTFAHPSSTCSMMRREYGGVVDSTLKVYGMKNLSIVDASLIPMTPATHIQSTVYAVAEKAADIIKSRQ
ncbi:alcohol oxidase [Morchella conica CCBAS932]|uniref:Alcohol oxidase n=1 Tax=Morchella conica CCBAS932 TaxID=1392247 RepID=A0A3N4KG85_9PEZI|nr:alcohol oxidase [Morchella conica CCBAS932]